MKNKKILLIICGGISAYKSLEVIRGLKKRDVSIKTILTKSGKNFVTPLSISSLSQEKVYEDIFSAENEAEMDHISLSRWADLILIVPATANTISKLSYGLTDDLASTVVLASNKQVFLVPAMNVRMWEHKSTQNNLSKLKSYGYKIIGPEIGDMACGEYGKGQMSEPSYILETIENYFKNIEKNKKFKALVTAGPTKEFIDPVRFITNKSSGKQGYEIAKSLRDSGFETTLISGETNLDPVEGVKFISVKTAEEMFRETLNNLPADVAIFNAAVADFRVKEISSEKIKKSENLDLKLEKNIDILSNISNHNSLRPKITIGFAAESQNLEFNSRKKLDQKNCDWIIANDISDKTIGFDSDDNEVSIFYKNKESEKLLKKKKSLIASEIVNRIISELNQVMVKVLFKRLNQKAKLPSYKTFGSSGMDLMACVDGPVIINPNESKLIPTGIAIAIPEDTEVQIRPRSGLAAKSSISVLNTPGTIDSDYRGELKIILFNHGKDEFIVNDEDRVAQMVLMPILKVEIEETSELPETIRGSGGFGSTGK